MILVLISFVAVVLATAGGYVLFESRLRRSDLDSIKSRLLGTAGKPPKRKDAAPALFQAEDGKKDRVVLELLKRFQLGPRLQELLERAGRRMVYATLLVVLALVLALVVPTAGPVRAQASAELFPMEPAVVVENNPTLIDDSAANPPLAPSVPAENGGKATQ